MRHDSPSTPAWLYISPSPNVAGTHPCWTCAVISGGSDTPCASAHQSVESPTRNRRSRSPVSPTERVTTPVHSSRAVARCGIAGPHDPFLRMRFGSRSETAPFYCSLLTLLRSCGPRTSRRTARGARNTLSYSVQPTNTRPGSIGLSQPRTLPPESWAMDHGSMVWAV